MTRSALGFATALLRRHRRRRPPRWPLSLVLRHRARAASAAAAPAAGRLVTLIRAGAVERFHTALHEHERIVERLERRTRLVARVETRQVAERLLERSHRVERMPAPRLTAAAQPPVLASPEHGPEPEVSEPPPVRPAAAPPVVVRRSSFRTPPPPEPTAAVALAPAGRSTAAAPPAAPPPAELDVGRLADQVIQVIDNRIVAQRERSGRL